MGWKKRRYGTETQDKDHFREKKYNYLKAERKLAKEHGIPIEEAVLSMVYSDKTQDSVKVAILKAYLETIYGIAWHISA